MAGLDISNAEGQRAFNYDQGGAALLAAMQEPSFYEALVGVYDPDAIDKEDDGDED
jgi:hypothetical protein